MSCTTCMEAAEAGRAPEKHEPCERRDLFELVGREVRGVFVAPREEAIAFATDAGVWRFDVEGDCCSTAWIADLLGVDALLDTRVVGVEPLELPHVNDGRCRQEEDAFYGVQVTTWRGRATLAYRCSSNGYYGGWMRRGVALEHVPGGWREVRDDWSAP